METPLIIMFPSQRQKDLLQCLHHHHIRDSSEISFSAIARKAPCSSHLGISQWLRRAHRAISSKLVSLEETHRYGRLRHPISFGYWTYVNFVTEAIQYCVHDGLQKIKESLAKYVSLFCN